MLGQSGGSRNKNTSRAARDLYIILVLELGVWQEDVGRYAPNVYV